EAWAKKPENATIVESTIELRKKEAAKDGNIRHILSRVSPTDGEKEHAKALAKITEAYARIERGEPFADVARALSDDSTKTKGGSLETEKSDSFVPSFKAAADALKNGEMTKTAIESQFGYHLIMKDDSSRLAKDVARELFYKSRSEDASRDLATRIASDMKAGKSADDASKQETASLKPIPFIKVTLDKSLDRKGPATIGDAGADATMTNATDAGKTATGDAGAAPAAAKVTVLDPQKDDDRPQALTSTSIRRGGDVLPHVAMADAAKLIDFSFKAKDGEAMGEPLKIETGGFYAVALKEHKLATKEEFDKDRVTYTETLLRARQNEALALYMKRLLDASRPDIKRDEAYMAEWTSDAGAGGQDDEEP
ncbi:MAG TPA: peptidylprolyl isomerase, partial [Polyangiaceae bacterium]